MLRRVRWPIPPAGRDSGPAASQGPAVPGRVDPTEWSTRYGKVHRVGPCRQRAGCRNPPSPVRWRRAGRLRSAPARRASGGNSARPPAAPHARERHPTGEPLNRGPQDARDRLRPLGRVQETSPPGCHRMGGQRTTRRQTSHPKPAMKYQVTANRERSPQGTSVPAVSLHRRAARPLSMSPMTRRLSPRTAQRPPARASRRPIPRTARRLPQPVLRLRQTDPPIASRAAKPMPPSAPPRQGAAPRAPSRELSRDP